MEWPRRQPCAWQRPALGVDCAVQLHRRHCAYLFGGNRSAALAIAIGFALVVNVLAVSLVLHLRRGTNEATGK